MSKRSDNDLIRRGAAARHLIKEGEDPFVMLLQVVWPDHDWADSAMLARLKACPNCHGSVSGCPECGSTGLVTPERSSFLALEKLADLAHDAT